MKFPKSIATLLGGASSSSSLSSRRQRLLQSLPPSPAVESPPSLAVHSIVSVELKPVVVVVAYDATQNLLALGCLGQGQGQGHGHGGSSGVGHVTVLGSHSKMVERRLQVPVEIPTPIIRLLSFKPNDGLLLAVCGLRWLVGWNLVRGSVDYAVELSFDVASMHVPAGTRWIFLGTCDGQVAVVDGERGQCTRFLIPCCSSSSSSSSDQEEDTCAASSVFAVVQHPQVADELLIGYAEGTVVLCGLRDQVILKRFPVSGAVQGIKDHQQAAHLTSLAWKPDGLQFLAGYSNGMLAIWDVGVEERPVHAWFLDQTLGSQFLLASPPQSSSEDASSFVTRDPIYQLEWSLLGNGATSLIAVSGGSISNFSGDSPSSTMKGIRLLYLDESASSDKKLAVQRQQFLSTSSLEINHICLLSASPWCSMDPVAIALVLSNGSLAVHDLLASGLASSALPPSLQFLRNQDPSDTPSSAFQLCSNIPEYLFNRMALLSPPSESILPMIQGGLEGVGRKRSLSISSNHSTSSPSPSLESPCTDILITLHQHDTLLRMWNLSEPVLRDLGITINLAMELLGDDPMQPICVSAIEILPVQRIPGGLLLTVTLSDGTILFYQFSLDTRRGSGEQVPKEPGPLHLERVDEVAPAGFQLCYRWRYHRGSPIQAYARHQNIYAFASADGKLSVVDVAAGTVLYTEDRFAIQKPRLPADLKEAAASVETSASSLPVLEEYQTIRSLAFTKSFRQVWTESRVLEKQKPSQTMEWRPSVVLLAGTEQGSVVALLMGENQVPTGKEPILLDHVSAPILYIFMVNLQGQPVHIDAPDLSDSLLDLNAFEQTSSKPEDLWKQSDGLPHFCILVSTYKVEATYFLSSLVVFEYTISKNEHDAGVKISKAQVARLSHIHVLMVVLSDGRLLVLSLPKLYVLYLSPFLEDTRSLDTMVLTEDGRMMVQDPTSGSLKEYGIDPLQNLYGLPESLARLHDPSRVLPQRPDPSTFSSSAKPSSNQDGKDKSSRVRHWLGSIKNAIQRTAGASPWSSLEEWQEQWKELDGLFASFLESRGTPASVLRPQRMQQATLEQQQRRELLPDSSDDAQDTSFEKRGASAGKATAGSAQNAVGQAAANLSERGERLETLETKMNALSMQTDGFLDAVRAYNRKQEQKKWYEF